MQLVENQISIAIWSERTDRLSWLPQSIDIRYLCCGLLLFWVKSLSLEKSKLIFPLLSPAFSYGKRKWRYAWESLICLKDWHIFLHLGRERRSASQSSSRDMRSHIDGVLSFVIVVLVWLFVCGRTSAVIHGVLELTVWHSRDWILVNSPASVSGF